MKILALLAVIAGLSFGQISPPPGGGGSPTGAAGGDLSGTYPNPTVAKIHGTTVPTNSTANQVALTTAAAVTAWTGVPNCLDSVGQHLNFNTTTHAFSCGTSGAGGAPGSPANSVQYNNAGAFGGYGTIVTTALSVPSAPTVANVGAAGSSDWSYKVSACTVVSCTAKSDAGSTSTGNATIDETNFNRPSVAAVTGASSYRWYRTVDATDPTTLGYIGTTTLPTIDDTGLTGYGNDSPQGSSAGLMIPDTLRVNNSIFLGTADGAVNSDSLDMLIAGPNTESGFIGNAYELSFFGLNGTPNNPTKSNSGDLLGFIAFWARKSTGYSDGANILAFADGDPDSGAPSPEDLCLGSFASGASPGSALDTRVSGNIDVLAGAGSCYDHTPNLSFRNVSGVFEINNGTPNTGGAVKIPALKSTTGTRFVCVDTDGNLTSSTTACSGT